MRVEERPELQPMLLRLGLACCDTNSRRVNRIKHVKHIAESIVALRKARDEA